jgi:hypothetical protein
MCGCRCGRGGLLARSEGLRSTRSPYRFHCPSMRNRKESRCPPLRWRRVRQICDCHLPHGPARAAAGVDGTCAGTGTLRSCSRGQLRRRGRGTCDEGLHRRSHRQARRSSAAGHPPRSRTPPMPGRRPATSGCRRSRDPKAPDVDQCCLSGRAAAGHRHRESARARPGPRRDVHDKPKGDPNRGDHASGIHAA